MAFVSGKSLLSISKSITGLNGIVHPDSNKRVANTKTVTIYFIRAPKEMSVLANIAS